MFSIRLCSASGCVQNAKGLFLAATSGNTRNPAPVPVHPSVVMLRQPHDDLEFVINILNKFRGTHAGKLCVTDRIIQYVRYRHYSLRLGNVSKMDEVRKSMMQEMRELARLLLKFKEVAADEGLDASNMGIEEMFSRQHLALLRETINLLAGDKYGLKLSIKAIILRTVKTLKGTYAERMDDAKCHELHLFTDAYKFRSHELFESAWYRAIAQSMDKARRPASLPEEDDMLKRKVYVRLPSSLTIQGEDYVLLRSLVVCHRGDREGTLQLDHPRRGLCPAAVTGRMSPGR